MRFSVLKPTSSPYNIAEKVKKANEALSMDNPDLDEREIKVKFKEDLVDYEPSLTEDDVNSIESDEIPEDDDYPQFFNTERNVFSDESVQSVINLNSDDLILEDVDDEEDVKSEDKQETTEENDDGESVAEEESIKDEETEEEAGFTEPEESFELPKETKKHKRKRKFTQNNRYTHTQGVDCRSHCIERLDLGLRIKKLDIHEKTVVRPILKLQERKCCEDNNKLNLPSYVGYRSEYGLSLEQLERREKINQIIRMKEEKRQQVLREFRERRRQQNEEVFCQWLRNVSNRRKTVTTAKGTKETLLPNIINLPPGNNRVQQQKARPVTAPLPPKSQFFVRQKRRPQTSPAYVYIQVPQDVLKRGINVGNVYVSLSKDKNKKVNIVTEC